MLGVKSQRCDSQILEAEKFTIVQREGRGLGKDLCKALSVSEKKCPKPFWPGLYVSFFYRQGETLRQRFLETITLSGRNLQRKGPITGASALCSVHSGKFQFDKNEKTYLSILLTKTIN